MYSGESSSDVKTAWNYFGEHKAEMLAMDKQEAYRRLSELQVELDKAWDEFKSASQAVHAHREKWAAGLA